MNAKLHTPLGTAEVSARPRKNRWQVPVALVVLSSIPVGAGLVRLARLAIGEAITVENARFFASPLPVIVHVISVSIFCVLGAFQFVPALRGRRGWHRVAGRLLVPFGVAAALSGLWMTLFYDLPVGSDHNVLLFQRAFGLLQLVRVFLGTGMVVSLCLGVAAIYRRAFERHRAWMMRAYAIGMGAGTQALLNLPWLLFVGKPEGPVRVLLMTAGWAINLAFVEWFIRTRPMRSDKSAPEIRHD